MDKFVKECGIGMKPSEEEIKKIIEETIVDATQESNLFDYLGKVKNKIPSVEGKTTKALFEEAWKAKGLPEKPVAADKKK